MNNWVLLPATVVSAQLQQPWDRTVLTTASLTNDSAERDPMWWLWPPAYLPTDKNLPAW